MRQHLEKRKFDLDNILSIKLTEGYKGISDSKTTKFLDEGFRQIKEEHKKDLLKKGYRRPIITKSKTSYPRYFEFYHPKNPFKKEKDKQLSISSPQSFYSPPSSSEILRQTPPEITKPKKYDQYGTEIRS